MVVQIYQVWMPHSYYYLNILLFSALPLHTGPELLCLLLVGQCSSDDLTHIMLDMAIISIALRLIPRLAQLEYIKLLNVLLMQRSGEGR